MTFTTAQREAVVKAARGQLGKAWEFLGEGPDGYDCSGSTLAAWKAGAGIVLPHYSAWQADEMQNSWVTVVPNSSANRLKMLPGDLVFYYPPSISHVAIFVSMSGTKRMIVNATNEERGVELIWIHQYAIACSIGYMGH